jgi:exonuclease SbcC
MIPVRLELEGLYSYREKQTIEFEQLTAAGLFGIFGAVGSGKSSILEAILVALYGTTDRLAATGERSSMVNLQSDHLLINFTFRAGKNNLQTYLARYSAKRNKKDPGKIDTGEHIFYHWEEGNWRASSQKAEEILGMGKEHFKQTVIIPQGKFREFIDQKPLDRAEMMQQLFGLDRFDLSMKTGILLKAAREEKIRLETQLAGLDDVSQEGLVEKTNECAALKKRSEVEEKTLANTEVEFRKLEDVRKCHQQLQEQKQLLAVLESKKSEVEEKRQLHREFITAKAYLRPVWDRLNDAKNDLEKYRTSVVDSERFKVRFELEVGTLVKEEEELKRKNEERPLREAKIRDLKKVIEIQQLELLVSESKKSTDLLLPELESKRSRQKQLEDQIAAREESLESTPIPDTTLLAELRGAARDLESWTGKIADLTRIQGQFLEEQRHVAGLLEDINGALPIEEKSLESWLSSQKLLLHQLEAERESILRNQGLASHAHLLESGKPCPLCGADHHPNPIQDEAQQQQLIEKEQQIHQQKSQLDRIQALIQKATQLDIHRENHRRNAEEKGAEIQTYKAQLATLQGRLDALGLQESNLLATSIKSISEAGDVREKLLQEIQSLRKKWQAERESLDKLERALQQAQLRQQSLLGQMDSKKEEIKDPMFCKPFLSKGMEVIKSAIDKVERDIEEAATALLGTQKHLQHKRGEQIKNLSDLENFRKLEEELAVKVSEFETEFDRLKSAYGFEDEASLIRILEKSIDAEKVDLEIRQYDQKLSITLNRIQELLQEPGVAEFSEENFRQLNTELRAARLLASETREKLILLQEDLKACTEKMRVKTSLLRSFSQTENRESNLKELNGLFQGKGFVKYVSSIYLRELCNTANLRFMKLTKNSLSLEIAEDNSFWVIDYLNGGKKRLLKTLSGGQTFQASLCLALALAEKVKSLNQADQSFFFLDEGFGALDKNALRVVFETLKSLRHENRIVGIISHVEELQQEVGVFAHVELDPESGSKVTYSY